MSRKKTKLLSFDQDLKKSMGKRAWSKLPASARAIARDFAKIENMGGPVGSSLPKDPQLVMRHS